MKILLFVSLYLVCNASIILAETKILCEGERAMFISENDGWHDLTETIVLTFNDFEIKATNQRCDKILGNYVTDSAIFLSCEFNDLCAADNVPINFSININRLTGNYGTYQSCIGLISEGTCALAKTKF